MTQTILPGFPLPVLCSLGGRPRAWLLAAILLAAALPASGALVPVEAAHELSLTQVRLPDAVGGTLYVTPCAGCRSSPLRVTARTEWRVGHRGDALALAEFRSQWSRALASSGRRIVFVYYEPGTQVVNRVVLLWEPVGVRP